MVFPNPSVLPPSSPSFLSGVLIRSAALALNIWTTVTSWVASSVQWWRWPHSSEGGNWWSRLVGFCPLTPPQVTPWTSQCLVYEMGTAVVAVVKTEFWVVVRIKWDHVRCAPIAQPDPELVSARGVGFTELPCQIGPHDVSSLGNA